LTERVNENPVRMGDETLAEEESKHWLNRKGNIDRPREETLTERERKPGDLRQN
jgi:hypothetical protein